MGVLRDLLRQSPLAVGDEAPPLSLTADDGTWIKLRDFQEHLNVVLVFFASEDDATERFLQALEAERVALEGLHAVIFGVNTNRTDRLRDIRAHLKLGFHLLYDPLALTARAFGMSRRALPFCRDGLYVVGKDQKVALASRGYPELSAVVEAIAQLEGVSPVKSGAATSKPASGASATRDPGKAAQRVQEIDSVKAESLIDAENSAFLLVDVRTLSEYEADHSPDAMRIQVDELPHRYHELKQLDRLIFVCQAGDRALAAAEFITSIGGHEIYAVSGGMSSWRGRRVTGEARSGRSGGE